VITTRNVTFNKELFYNTEEETTTIPVVKAVGVVDVLYKASEITDTGEAIKLSIAEGEDLLLSASTKQ
jgi:sensor domain CHASE-containing protein